MDRAETIFYKLAKEMTRDQARQVAGATGRAKVREDSINKYVTEQKAKFKGMDKATFEKNKDAYFKILSEERKWKRRSNQLVLDDIKNNT